MTNHRLYTLSPSGERYHVIPAELLADAVAIARRTHAERTGDDPNLIHVTTRDALHPIWTPVSADMARDITQVRQS